MGISIDGILIVGWGGEYIYPPVFFFFYKQSKFLNSFKEVFLTTFRKLYDLRSCNIIYLALCKNIQLLTQSSSWNPVSFPKQYTDVHEIFL